MRTVIPIKQVDMNECGKDSDGWERRAILSEPRLSEMAEIYRSLGYEVEVRDVQRSASECNVCFEGGSAIGQAYGTLFTRRTTIVPGDDDSMD